jgi:hypothetical protein
MKIKANHPFTSKQLKRLNEELKKISDLQVVGMKGTKLPSGKKYYADIEVKSTPFSLDIYLSFTNLTESNYPKSELWQIDSKGILNKNIRAEMEFDTLADRISFFANLESIDFKY